MTAAEAENKAVWARLLSAQKRLRHEKAAIAEAAAAETLPDFMGLGAAAGGAGGGMYFAKLPQEEDLDRILFSGPLRRLGDKTQLFPLDSIESVRSRLTHSYEVANLARFIGTQIAGRLAAELPPQAMRIIPAMLAAVSLAHDIGNPPFGHQGENAIRAWFQRNSHILRFGLPAAAEEQCRQDFLRFEGNAQALRVLTKLQVISDDVGLNLTYGTLAAVMKYTVPAHQANMKAAAAAAHKPGFFYSEREMAADIRRELGLSGLARHPLALIMEACDDIAYSVFDVEDCIKKGLFSYNDLIEAAAEMPDSPVKAYILHDHQEQMARHRGKKLHPKEMQDILMQMFRVNAIHLMVSAVAGLFIAERSSILRGEFAGELIEDSAARDLCRLLKRMVRDNSYHNKNVLQLNLKGSNIINELMNYFWLGITDRQSPDDLASPRSSLFAAYVYSRISQNYKRIFESSRPNARRPSIEFSHNPEQTKLPIRYLELQLMTDMLSGMTDRFCIELHQELSDLYRRHKPVAG